MHFVKVGVCWRTAADDRTKRGAGRREQQTAVVATKASPTFSCRGAKSVFTFTWSPPQLGPDHVFRNSGRKHRRKERADQGACCPACPWPRAPL